MSAKNTAEEKEGNNSRKNLGRRSFLKWGLGTAVAGLVGWGGYACGLEPHWVQVVRRRLPIRYLPSGLEGKTLVQISDLHVGPVVDRDYIIATLERVNSLEPDILVITGDFMTCDGNEQLDQLQVVLEHLKPANLAALAIFGNHDYGERWMRDDVADHLARRLPNLGIRVLRNEVATVDGLCVAGIDDYWGTNFHPSEALTSLRADQANLVLCHNPDVCDLDVWDGYQGWILSGHTHGGQCRFPFVGAPILPVKNKKYVSGELDLQDGRRLYINPGVGYLRRVRFCVRPEITVFTLTRDSANEQ